MPNIENDVAKSMTHKNKKKGNNYETRFLEKRKKEGAKRTWRHYGSLGATDVEWTDKNGQRHEAQLKFSSIRQPKVSAEHLEMLEEYSDQRPNIKIWTVCKERRKPEVWTLIGKDKNNDHST